MFEKVYAGEGRILAIERFVRKSTTVEGNILTVERFVQRGLGENVKPAAEIATLREKKAEECKVFRTDCSGARKVSGGR